MDFKSLKYHCLHIKWLQNGNVLAAIVDHTKMSTFVLIGGQRNPLKSLSVCSYSSRFFTTCLRQRVQNNYGSNTHVHSQIIKGHSCVSNFYFFLILPYTYIGVLSSTRKMKRTRFWEDILLMTFQVKQLSIKTFNCTGRSCCSTGKGYVTHEFQSVH